ncbi:hypothetical protein [Algoriphagus jejuensis]|uniref:hypothetical protein n=1 Tax=Algoriphagus jejuensis TaxID=419934 RepID=UPI0031DC1EC6
MIVQAVQSPTFDEVLAALKGQFSDCSIYPFESKPQRSIIVRKSATVGAQITVHKDEIRVDACCPNIFVSGLIGFINTIFPFYYRFEMKVSDFLKNTYK